MKKLIREYELKKEYDQLFDYDPLTANIFLLLFELADENGNFKMDSTKELKHLMKVRFDDPRGYNYG